MIGMITTAIGGLVDVVVASGQRVHSGEEQVNCSEEQHGTHCLVTQLNGLGG